jgi:hypothetical protein
VRNAKFILLLALLSGPALAEETAPASSEDAKSETAITLFAGSDYITGDLSGQEYETVGVSAGARATTGRFSFAASIPYIVTSAPEDLIVSGGGLLGTSLLSRPSTQPGRVTREGIGDLTLQADYQLPLDGLNAVVGGSIKVPTASRKAALGTGEVDFGINGLISRRFGEVIPFVTAGYTMIGEPDGFDVRNTLSGAAGTQFVLSNLSSVTFSYSYDQAATKLVGDNQSVGLGFATNLASRLQLGVDARAGLSADAPDARLGIRLGVGF